MLRVLRCWAQPRDRWCSEQFSHPHQTPRSSMSLLSTRLRNATMGVAALAALGLGGSALAGAATSGTSTSATTPSGSPPSGAPAYGAPAGARPDPTKPGGHVGANGKTEAAL